MGSVGLEEKLDTLLNVLGGEVADKLHFKELGLLREYVSVLQKLLQTVVIKDNNIQQVLNDFSYFSDWDELISLEEKLLEVSQVEQDMGVHSPLDFSPLYDLASIKDEDGLGVSLQQDNTNENDLLDMLDEGEPKDGSETGQ